MKQIQQQQQQPHHYQIIIYLFRLFRDLGIYAVIPASEVLFALDFLHIDPPLPLHSPARVDSVVLAFDYLRLEFLMPAQSPLRVDLVFLISGSACLEFSSLPLDFVHVGSTLLSRAFA